MSNPQSRVIRTAPSSIAGIYIEDNSVTILGDHRNFIVCDERGITLKGPLSFISDGMERRTGGLFVELPDMVKMIPSTIITPLPAKLPIPPVTGIVNIVKDVAFFACLLV